MAARKSINEVRFKAIYQKQLRSGWCENYAPPVLTALQEAPSISRVHIPTNRNKPRGRKTHLLSTAKRDAALLKQYRQQILTPQEQRMLPLEAYFFPHRPFQGMAPTTLSPIKDVIVVRDGQAERYHQSGVVFEQVASLGYQQIIASKRINRRAKIGFITRHLGLYGSITDRDSRRVAS